MEEVYYGKSVLSKMCTMRMRKGKKYILAMKQKEGTGALQKEMSHRPLTYMHKLFRHQSLPFTHSRIVNM